MVVVVLSNTIKGTPQDKVLFVGATTRKSCNASGYDP